MHFDWNRFTYNEAWLHQAVQTEVDSDWDAQVGASTSLPPKPSAHQIQAQLRQVKILSLLFQELHALLQQANLGAATEAASVKGRQLIYQQLPHLSPQQQAYFEALLQEEKTTLDDRPLRAQLPQVLRNILSPQDWQEIAQAAMSSIQSHLMEHVSLQRSA